MEQIYDLIIVGSGPAGLAAGIYAARAEFNMLIVEKEPINGGQINNTYEIENYPGIPGGSGYDLANKFRAHCDNLGVQFTTNEVQSFAQEADIKVLTMEDGEVLRARAVILAMGTQYKRLGVKGEEELSGLGVSYCATCDGAFFRNKITAVAGGGDVAIEDAIFLSRICEKVYLIHRRDAFRGTKTLVRKLESCANVEVIWDCIVDEICGEEMVEGIVIRNVKTQEIRTVVVNGIFVAIGTIPNSDLVKGIVEMDEMGFIRASEDGVTNVQGVFAAGDIRTKALRQVITAASDGANALTSVEHYLNEVENR